MPARKLVLLVLAGVLTVLALGPGAGAASAAPCDAPIVSPVACENTKVGNPPSEWDVAGGGSTNIQGYTTDISTNVGGVVTFKVDTSATAYRIDGKVIEEFPMTLSEVARAEPIYETHEGWSEDLTGCRRFSDLPAAARRYVERVDDKPEDHDTDLRSSHESPPGDCSAAAACLTGGSA